MTVEDARQRYRLLTRRGLVQHFIGWDEFTTDTLALTQQILERFPAIAGIAGCPRSGMRAAADIALRLGVPLYEASAQNGLRKLAGGLRLEGKMFSDSALVMVEDSACTGQSVARLRSHEDLQLLPVYAVYATQQASKLLSGYAVAIEPPHWFDWHFFHCRELLKQHAVGIDWDGVLNVDCPRECDDDGRRYREWLDAVRPIRRPDWIPTIITARLEAYRDQCLQWLARYRIECDQLVMFPGSFADRANTNIGLWKASMCDEHVVEMFVESDLMQAQTIAAKRNKLTLSIERPQ